MSWINEQTGNYTIQPGDENKTVVFNSASACTATIPYEPWLEGGTFRCTIVNNGAGVVSVAPSGCDLDGSSSSVSLAQNESIDIYSDGSDYFSGRGTISSGGSGTVTNVSMTVPSRQTVTGSPVTSSGTLAVTDNTQSANTFFRGPTSGSAATPSFGVIVSADLPLGSSSQLGAIQVDGTTITASAGVISAVSGGTSPVDIQAVAISATSLNPLAVQANTVIDLNHFLFADGTDLWSAGPAYSANGIYIDDFTLTATANPTKFSAAQILNVITKFMANLDGAGNIPATVSQSGTSALFYSGFDQHQAYVAGDGWASIPLLLQLYYEKTGSLTPYTSYVSAVKTAMALIPRNGSNHLLTVVTGNEYVCGTLFMEYMRNTGDVAWGNVCYVRACQTMLALATAASDATNVTFFGTEVSNVVAGIKSTLIDGTTGMLIAATGQNSTNLDVPSSTLAVYLGILTSAQNTAIANYLHTNYATLVNSNGYILQSPAGWSVIGVIPVGGGAPYGSTGYTNTQYQGGYWSFHFAWFCHALSLVSLTSVGTLINTFLNGANPATEYYNRGSTSPAGTTPNLESPQGAKLAMDIVPSALTTPAGGAAVNAYGAIVAGGSIGTSPLTISGTPGSTFTQSSVSDATIWVENSSTSGSGAIGCRDNTGAAQGGFGYANSAFSRTYLQSKCYFYSVPDLIFTAQLASGPALTIDAATNGLKVANTLTVNNTASSTGTFQGTIKAGGANNSVIMGELNNTATLGGNNAAFTAWSNLAIQPAGTASTLVGVVPSTTTPIAKFDNSTGITTLGGALSLLSDGIISTLSPTSGSSCTGFEGQWVLAPDGHIYFANATSHLWVQAV
jgi:hypothetical protein